MINISDFKKYKDRAISFGWVLGLLILIALLWILTQPIQANTLLRTVNRVFITAGQPYRIASHLPHTGKNSHFLGFWYSMQNTSDRMFVFAVMQDGILAPLGARVTSNGDVEELIPLSAHAVQIMEKIPQNILQMHIVKIETAAKNSAGGRTR